jgi:hypothetical protein
VLILLSSSAKFAHGMPVGAEQIARYVRPTQVFISTVRPLAIFGTNHTVDRPTMAVGQVSTPGSGV